MINRVLIALILLSNLGFAPAAKKAAQPASATPPAIQSLILAGKAKEAARLAAKTKGAFDETMSKLLNDVDNQITDRKIADAQKEISAVDAFLNAYAAIDKAKVLPRDAVKGRLLRIEGIQLSDNKEYEKAETVLRQALQASQNAKDSLLEAGVHNNLGYALRSMRKPSEAAKEFAAAVQMAEAQKDDLRAGSYNINLGETQLEQDTPESALSSFKKAAEQNRAAGRPEREARALFLQATAMDYLDLKGNTLSIQKQNLDLYKQAADIYEKLGDERNAAATWYVMAETASNIKQWDQVTAYGEKALPYYVKAADRAGQHACYTILAEAYKGLRNKAKTDQYTKLASETEEKK